MNKLWHKLVYWDSKGKRIKKSRGMSNILLKGFFEGGGEGRV